MIGAAVEARMKRLLWEIVVAALLGLGAAPALATSALSSVGEISPANIRVTDPVLAVSGDGRMAAAWDVVDDTIRNEFVSGHSHIQARLGRAGRGWGPVATLAKFGSEPDAAVGNDGTVALAWRSEEIGRAPLQLSIAAPGRPFGRSVAVTRGRSYDVFDGVEVLPDDRVVVVWSRALESEAVTNRRLRSEIEYAVFTPGGRRQRSGVVAETNEGEEEPELVTVAQTSTGSLLVAFPPLSRASSTEQLAVLPAGASTFAPLQTIRALDGGKYELDRARVSAGPGGVGLTMTLGTGDGLGVENRLVEAPEGGMFGSGVPIDRSSGGPGEIGHAFGASLPKVAFAADGTRVAAWTNSSWAAYHEGTGRLEERMVMLTTRPPGASAFTAPVALSISPGFAGEPLVASAGSATVVVWPESDTQLGGAPSCPQHIEAVVRAENGSLSPARLLSSRDGRSVCDAQLVAAGSSRYAIVGWLQRGALRVATLTG